MFQAYKMKYVNNSIIPGKSYRYKNCTIISTNGDGQIMVSICPHGSIPSLPEKEEVEGILRYLGINPDAPLDHFTIKHSEDPAFGDTSYYVQDLVLAS